MATSTSPWRWSTVSPTAGSLGAVVPAPAFEAGSVGPASEEEAHPAISIAIATAIAIQGRYERLGLILVMGRVSRSCTWTHLLSRFGYGEDVQGGRLRTAGTR